VSLHPVSPGVDLFAQDLGAGRPVVLLHGWALSHEVWDRQIRVLLEAGRRVIAVDLRGHGASTKCADGYDVERLSDDVAGLLRALGVGDVDLVGWSLGGLTAFALAARHPEQVRRLVLVGSNGVATTRQKGFPFGARAEEHEDAVVAAELSDRLGFRRQVIAGAFRKPPATELIDWLLRLSLQSPSWVGAACLRTLIGTNQVDAAPELAVPLVQVFGADDPVLSKRGARWLMETVPDGRQIVVGDAGHYPMLENAAEFDAALIDAVGAR
jgi:pimeloyl-ACP methyl ester carboxylesterase